MPTGILDSFQIVVALYLFYIAFKGSGQMYRFGDMDEDEMRKSCMFDNLQEKMAAMKLDMDVEDAGVEVSDVDEDWEEKEARRHLKDLSKKIVVPEKYKKVKVMKPKYKKVGGETYGQLA